VLAQQSTLPVNSKTFTFEIIGGASLLRNTGYYGDFMSPKFGYSAGVGFNYSFTPTFSISTRGLWELKGSKSEQESVEYVPNVDPLYGTYALNTNFNYLTLSVLPTFKVGRTKRISLGVGGYYSFLQRAEVTRTYTDHATNTTTSQSFGDLGNFSPKYDVGVSVFAGYTFKFIGKSNCSVIAMYNNGLVDIEDPWNGYQRNNSLQLMLVFGIPASR
jgi:hypothetical protein